MSENAFAGVWRLLSCDASREDSAGVPVYGKSPIGRLYYDESGNMSVHIMRAGRPRFKSDSKFRATQDEMRAAYESYEAYFSTYVVDADQHIIRHTVIGGLFPNWAGSVQTRFYAFFGSDRLVLSTAPIGVDSGGATVVTLIWERIKPTPSHDP
jgi:hypothetical protein